MKFNKFFIFVGLLFESSFLSILINFSLNSNIQATNVSTSEIFDISKIIDTDVVFTVNVKNLYANDQPLTELNLNLEDKLWEKVWKQSFRPTSKFNLVKKLVSEININREVVVFETEKLPNDSRIVLTSGDLSLDYSFYSDREFMKRASSKHVVPGSALYIKVSGRNQLFGTLILKIELV